MLLLPGARAGLVPGSKNIGAVWFIGDSITQSNADNDDSSSPRKSLYDLLTANGYTFTYTGHHTANMDGLPSTGGTPESNLYHYHSGISGSVIGNDYSGRTGMTQNTPTFWSSGRLAVIKPNVILILLGANDVDQAIDLPNAPGRLKALVQTIHAQPGVGTPTIFVASITPNRTSPDDPANVAAFNAAVPGVVAELRAEGKDVRYVDQFTPIENAYAANMMGDNLHPNTTGNNTMARQWFNAIAGVVEGPIVVTGANVSAQTDNSPAAGYATAAAFSGEIVTNDLINAGQPTLRSAAWDKTPFFESDPVNDGDGHPAGSFAGTFLPATFGGGAHMPFTYTAALETNVNRLGYEITEIRSYAGWNQNGSKLANQKYELLVRTVGNAEFTSLGTFTYAPFGTSDTAEAAATKMVLTASNGVIATGVEAVRFVVMDHGITNGGPADGSVFFEFDVIGSAITVPPTPRLVVTGTNVSAQTDNSHEAGYATASAFSGDIVSDDLINAGQPSLLSAGWNKPPFFENDPVNDGDGHPAGSGEGTYLPATLGGLGHMPFTYTATLDTSVNSFGYEITEIRSYAGWDQNGSKLANQKYELLVRKVGDAGWTSLGTLTYAPFNNADTAEAAATKMVLTATNGVIATGVEAVRFVVMNPGFNNGALTVDGTVYYEFDVIGSPLLAPPPRTISVGGTNVSAQTDNSPAAGYATAAAFTADIVANDLINAGQASLVSAAWDKRPFFESDPVNDGDGHPAATGAGTYLPATFGGAGHLPFTYTAVLETNVNRLGYRIMEIRSYAGWNQNGSKLANQKYELLVRVVGDSEFTSLGTFAYTPFDDADTAEAAATRMVLRKGGSAIATGIDAVRFVVMNPGFNNGNTGVDGSVYQEFDVMGSPIPVPPVPATTILGTNLCAQTDNSAAAGYPIATAFSGDIVADDLINVGQPSLLAASWDKPPFFESDPVNDGDGHLPGWGEGTFLPATFGMGNHLPFAYTAILDTSVNPLGYRISEIRSFAGWNQNGAALANQKYELQVRCVGSPLWTSLGVYEYSPFTSASTQEAAASKMTITASNNVIATGVDAVRFVVLDHGFNSSDIAGSPVDGSVFFEFDVLGSAVPAAIAISATGSEVVVTFTGVLQSAPAVTGPFADVEGYPSSPLVLPKASLTNTLFFRSRTP